MDCLATSIKENRKVLYKPQEARTHAIDQQENITILQAQLQDALKFQNFENRRASGNGTDFGGFWNRGKKETPKQPEEDELEDAQAN
ncbi:hypothetical protein IV203_015592 [Nitzschia inconspicua]|uniref:Uncharacterized protein n=1 Tax=Nitzschia inconspicua TaxID=303405 RepID=A0A9K3LBL4_9STRA|nr:hypothetical protein IV203_015592 [Nitzschia inconspicua]